MTRIKQTTIQFSVLIIFFALFSSPADSKSYYSNPILTPENVIGSEHAATEVNNLLQEGDCTPGNGWVWAYGPEQPLLAEDARQALSQEGILTSVEASSFGEQDSCGTYYHHSTDFRITFDDPGLDETDALRLGGRIFPILESISGSRLGNVRFTFQDGTSRLIQRPDQVPPGEFSIPVETTSPQVYDRRVYVLIFDPMLRNGQTLSEYMGWYDYNELTNQVIDFFKQVTNNRLNYSVVYQTVSHTWPVMVDGFRYDEDSWFPAWYNQVPRHTPAEADYNAIIDSPEFDACGKLNRGEIDEMWMWGDPLAGFYESRLAGPGAYWYNSGPVPQPNNCQSLLPIMGFNYERDYDMARHDFFHRFESAMWRTYRDWQQNRNKHNWDRFTLVKHLSPDYSYSGCGNGHYPPNGTGDYDTGNMSIVQTNCYDFANYPNLADPLTVLQPISCPVWGCSELGWQDFWFRHIPSNAGCGYDGIANDWWNYLATPALANLDPPLCHPPFTKTSPADGSVDRPSHLPLYWSSSQGATSYEYCLDTIDNHECDASWISVGSELFALVSDLAPETSYYWQVRALGPLSTTYADYDKWFEFTTRSESSCPTITNWKGEYWDNTTLAGGPLVCRNDFSLDFGWDLGSPHPDIPNDLWSARWTRTLDFPAGSYRFHMEHDDGARLYVDDVLQIDAWGSCCQWEIVDLSLSAGDHTIRMEYWENGGWAAARLWWERLDIAGWRAEYFNNPDLSSHPAVVRNDDAIDFDWLGESPDPLVQEDQFSARWTRNIYFSGGSYEFEIFHDDGARLYLDGLLVFENWCGNCRLTEYVEIEITPGYHTLRYEVFENGGWAGARIEWSSIFFEVFLPLVVE